MCGIAGIVRFDGAPVAERTLRAMADRLAHRGPDDEGFFIDGGVGLGHRRLSIIDLNQSAQPMSSGDGRHEVCFNGEILNYRELRSELNYPFKTAGDTEVLLASFDRWGPASVERLRGQFAYALYDRPGRVLWLVRDRLGILPLFYYVDQDMLVFASEINALIPALARRPDVDRQSILAYLGHRYVPSPWTMLKGVRKLPAGNLLRVPIDGGSIKPSPYWVPEMVPELNIDVASAKSELDRLLLQSVRRNLVADVPVGTLLSGGLDSSLITSLVRESEPASEIHTFSAGFADDRFSESGYARQVSEFLGTTHHEIIMEPQSFVDLWRRLSRFRDAPISQSSDVAVYELGRLASGIVKVVLSGEGSDELFAGYPKHLLAGVTRWAGLVPRVVRQPVLDSIQRKLPVSAAKYRIAARALSEPTFVDRSEGWFASFLIKERAELLPETPEHGQHRARVQQPLKAMLRNDLGGWLSDNLLARGDAMMMASSVELRPPFLDADLVTWALRLPTDLLIRGRETKLLVRQVAMQRIPDAILARPKLGFVVPLDEWFRQSLRQMVEDLLLSPTSCAASLFSTAPLRELIQRHVTGRSDESLRLWTLMSLEHWHAAYVAA